MAYIGLLVATFACAACAREDAIPSATESGASAVPADGASLTSWLEYFDSKGELADIDAQQRAVLENAASTGELEYADVAGLIELTFDCVEQQGLTAHWEAPLEDYGYPVPAYSISESLALGSSASQAVMDQCVTRYSGLAEQLYVWQPVNYEIAAAKWDRDVRPALVACLRDNGVQIDDNATRQEIKLAAVALSQPTGPTNAPVFGPNCLAETS